MKCVIHHAYFLPWLGYFSKLSFADKFILLDDALFSKGFYHDRTKYINSNGEVKWLTIPVGQNFKRYSNAVILKDKSFLNILIKSIEQSYAKAKFFKSEWPFLKHILVNSVQESDTLFELNVSIIKSICKLLEINTPIFVYSSTFLIDKAVDKTEKLINICKAAKCDELIVGDGNSLVEHNIERVEKAGITVLVQAFYANHPSYFQVRRQRAGFEKGVSILDAILNIGRYHTALLINDSKIKPKTNIAQ